MAKPGRDPSGEESKALPVRPFLRQSGAAGAVPADGTLPALPIGEPAAPADDTVAEHARPFLLAAGRAGTGATIPIEAQVLATAEGRGALATLRFEDHDIVHLCDEPLAVAEVAARLSLHLGLTRVLLEDLRHRGMVTMFEPAVDASHDVDTILRVINGLRQLS